MSAIAGYGSALYLSGTGVPVTDEACTSLGSGVYQVTSTSRRVWDPDASAHPITIKDGGSTVSSTYWSFDYLFGRVTFSGYSPSGAVTVDGSYLPMTEVGEVHEHSIDAKANLLDSTSYNSTGYTSFTRGLASASGSFAFRSNVLDTVSDVSIQEFLENGTPKVLALRFGGSYYFKLFCILEGVSVKSTVNGLVEGTASFSTAAQGAGAAVSWGT